MPSLQLKPILDNLERHKHLFDLGQGNLGRTLHGLAVDVIQEHMDREQDPDGAPWPDLSPAYAAHKFDMVGPQPMAVLHGIMKTRENLEGEEQITATEATFTFGQDEQAREEAVWFSEGNAHQPARPFYALGVEAVRRITQFLDLHFAKHVFQK